MRVYDAINSGKVHMGSIITCKGEKFVVTGITKIVKMSIQQENTSKAKYINEMVLYEDDEIELASEQTTIRYM